MSLENYNARLDSLLAEWSVPGLAVSVIHGDAVLQRSAHGQAVLEPATPVTPDTRFPIASMTKSFTAMMIALLVADGELEWDKPVRHYLPEFILKDAYATRHITVRDMLSHRSGLPRHDLAAWREEIPLPKLIERMQHLDFFATFREKFYYNNLMYYASAYLVERISGQRWQDFMHERIFAPLSMTATNLSTFEDIEGHPIAQGYRAVRDEEGVATGDYTHLPFGPITDVSPGAAGAMVSTLNDVTTWLKLHINGGLHNGEQFIPANHLHQLHAAHTIIPGGALNQQLFGHNINLYALGWFLQPFRGDTLVQHGGNVEGHSTIMGFMATQQVGVVVLANAAITPLRDLVLYDAIDRVLGHTAKDWNTEFHKLYDVMFRAMEQSKVTAAQERLADAAPTHPLGDYTGSFETDGYGDLEIRETEDGLQARLGGLEWSGLQHYHYDIFEWHINDFDTYVKIHFRLDDQGEPNTLAVPLEVAVDNPIIFTRKPVELPATLLAAMTGTYDTPYEGMALEFYAQQDKLYVAATSQTPEEVKAAKLTDAVVVLRGEQARYEFVRDGEQITKMVVKAPMMTLEATRHTDE